MTDKQLTTVFCGTSAFAVPSLEALAASRHRVAAVVTQPDAPSGRGRRLASTPVKSTAQRLGLAVLQPATLGRPDALDALQAYRPDLLVVVAYGQILSAAALALPPSGAVGLHASLLPKYRGAAPINRAIMNGETMTGLTTFQIVPEVDAGPILQQQEMSILPTDTALTLAERMALEGATLLVRTLEAMAQGRLAPRPQDLSAVTYAPKLTKRDGLIDWSHGAQHLRDRIRAMVPWPGAYTFLRGRLVKVLEAQVVPADREEVQAGEIVAVEGGRLVVGTGRGRLALIAVQPEARRPMTASAFISGYRVKPGMRFDNREARSVARGA